ncbi:g8541 [Coccomyxa viridis]|uniref:G8541 protein n=1 Tax=Coccomyxa viridis TaxID=1274662 RepID=A0ABP1G0R3_9CHLO
MSPGKGVGWKLLGSCPGRKARRPCHTFSALHHSNRCPRAEQVRHTLTRSTKGAAVTASHSEGDQTEQPHSILLTRGALVRASLSRGHQEAHPCFRRACSSVPACLGPCRIPELLTLDTFALALKRCHTK